MLKIHLYLLAGLIAFCSLAQAAAGQLQYLVAFEQEQGIPVDASERIALAGGVLETTIDEIGMVVATSNDPQFAARLAQNANVASVGVDRPFQLRSFEGITEDHILSLPRRPRTAEKPLLVGAKNVVDQTQAEFFSVQWNMQQIQAPEAWAHADGTVGIPEVTVAVVESGIDYTHPELEGKVDLSRSVSFVPEEDRLIAEQFPGIHPSMDLNVGGTMVAGIIACNAIGTACVAPNVTLISVKTVDSHSISTHTRHIQGLTYAALLGVDVIAASFGGTLEYDDPNFDAIVLGYSRAVKLAETRGALVIAGVGTIARDAGINADQSVLEVLLPPAQLTSAIGVLSTGPIDQENFDHPSTFANWGNTLIELAAPGGGGFTDNGLDNIASPCTSFSELVDPCRIDSEEDEHNYLLFSAGNFAMAHVAGVAALIDSLEGGSLNAQQLRQRLYEAADDLGEPGRDSVYGYGRINALLAVE